MRIPIQKYTPSQQRAIVVLGCITIISLYALLQPLKTSTTTTTHADSTLIAQILNFQNHLANQTTHDSIQQSHRRQLRQHKYDSLRHAKYAPENTQHQHNNFTFDPNTLDSSGFVKLGLKPHIAKNIIRYRLKGGKFRTPADLLKIYNIDTPRVHTLLSYIHIAQQPTSNPKPQHNTAPAININTADTAALQRLPHIAKARAAQIIYYRQRLGGFLSPSQILEACTTLSQQQLTTITKQIYIDTTAITKIPVNRSSVNRLKAHPYINFYQAKAIYDLRWENNGKLNNINDLLLSNEISPQDIKKLEHYLSFE